MDTDFRVLLCGRPFMNIEGWTKNLRVFCWKSFYLERSEHDEAAVASDVV